MMEGKSNVDSAEPVGLVPASFQIHARKLLHQLLKDASIPDHVFREEQVFAVLADAVKKLDPDVQHGADMDLRNGLKVKPITRDGLASPAWVDGLLYAADVPLKWESQIVLDARILVLNFGIIPAEEEQALTTFNNLVGREAEHVSKLVDSIVRLHPTLLLVKGNVTSDAINSLRQSGVAVAHNIKASILQEVSAVTGATVVTSANQLSNSQISLGGCRRFEAKKYRLKGVKRQYFMFKDIPGGSVGTIALRGNDEKLLKRMKSVMMTMAYAMYNMKLERSLLVDQFASLSVFLGSMGLGKAPGLFMGPNQASDDISLQHTKLITPPPIPTTKSTSCLLDTGSTSSRLDSNVTGTDDIICISVSPFVLNTPPVDLPSQYTSKNDDKPDFEPLRDAAINEVSRKEGNDSKGNKGKSKMDQNEKTFDLVTPEMLHNPAVIPAGSFKCRPVLRKALKVKCQRDLEDHQRRLMRSRGLVHGNDGDSNLSFTDEFVVIYHSLNTETSSCCTGAETIVIKFYKQKAEKNKTFHPDLPLGQYIENLVDNVNSPCKSVDCNDPIGDHQRRYVHGRAKITVSVNVHPSKLHGAEDEILMWNCCRLCERETPAISMSTDTWKYSFGQYLQLSFCCRKLFTDHLHCTHDLHRDYLRYFGYKGLAIEFAYEPLDLFGVAVPPTQVCWDVEKDLILRNELYATAESQIDRFFRSVRSRIHSVRSQNQKTVKSNEFSAKLYRLLALAKGDQHVLKRKLEDVYARTEYYDTLSFNITISSLQEKALSWEATFENVENELLSTIRELSNNVACESPKGDDELITRSTQENPDDILKNSTIQEPQTAPNNDFEAVEKDVDDNNRENSVSQRSRGHSLDKGERPNDNDYDVAASKSLPATSPPPWSKPTSPVDDNQQAHTTKRKSAYSYEEDRGRPAPRPERRLKPNDPRPPASIDDILNASEQDTNATHSNIGRRRPRSRSRFRSKLRSLLSPTRRRRGSPDPNVPPIPTSEPTTSVDGTFKQKNTPFDFSPPNSTSTVGPPSPDVINTDRTKGSRVSGMLGRLRRELKPDKLAAQERWPRLMPTKRLASTTSEFSIDDAMTPTGSQERTTWNNAGDPVKKPILEKQPAATPSTALCDEHTKDIKDHTDGKDKSDNTVAEIEKHPNGTEETRNPRMDPTQDLQKEKIDVQKAEVLPAMDQPLNAEIPAYGNDDNASDNGNDSDRSVEQSEETQRQEQPQHTITSLITSFFSDRTENALTPLDYPLRTIDHLFVDTNIIVREDEPTSFIALSLGTEEYKEKLEKSNLNNKQEKRKHEGKQQAGEPISSDETVKGEKKENTEHSRSDQNLPSGESFQGIPIKRRTLTPAELELQLSLLNPEGLNIQNIIEEDSARMECQIFFADNFDALRKKCGVSERIIESLSRCTKFDSKGGKSHAIFLKTLDDRFILKSLSQFETQAFLTFAPEYFKTMNNVIFNGMPSCIAKMFGLFWVSIKNTVTGYNFQHTLLLMENLFYNRSVSKTFDLKGSMRNRKVPTSNEVLLDENMFEYSYSNPLVAHPHGIERYKQSIWNDTVFLSQQNIVDYSLMFAVDREKHEIVIGIIDCICPYTWDKKWESWFKNRGALNGKRKKKPTIISPNEYKQRFRDAMAVYLTPSPGLVT